MYHIYYQPKRNFALHNILLLWKSWQQGKPSRNIYLYILCSIGIRKQSVYLLTNDFFFRMGYISCWFILPLCQWLSAELQILFAWTTYEYIITCNFLSPASCALFRCTTITTLWTMCKKSVLSAFDVTSYGVYVALLKKVIHNSTLFVQVIV